MSFISSILGNILCVDEKIKIYVQELPDGIVHRSLLGPFGLESHLTVVSLLIFCLNKQFIA